MRFWTFLCGMLLLAACSERAAQREKYGAPLALHDETKVSAILAEPENFVGKRVLISGKVSEVCAKAGCWMEINDETPAQKIKVKVNDGEIVFPMTAKGKTAQVEGEVYRIELDAEQARGYMAHLAEEKGVSFDPSSVNGPMTIYQIKGIGAEIWD